MAAERAGYFLPMLTPKPRGPLSDALFPALRHHPEDIDAVARLEPDGPEDEQISLWALYELHHRGFDDVDDELEWHPGLMGLRRRLETAFEGRLRDRWTPSELPGVESFAEELFAFVEGHDGASLASYVHRHADEHQVLDLFRLRSVYHLKDGDPTRLHTTLFVRGLDAVGLRSEYGWYVDDVPLEILEQNNAMSLFGLHRRLRGAALGHLAAFEATSSMPSRRMAQGLARLGMAQEMIDYYEEHVAADAVHEQLAVRTICGALVEEDPSLIGDVFFGAFSCLDLEDRFARSLLAGWAA